MRVSRNQSDAVVIVGGGQAGGRVAITLRELGYQGEIVLIGEENLLPYERPALSKGILNGQADPESLALGNGTFWSDSLIEMISGVTVHEIDASDRKVFLSNGDCRQYGTLVLATGACPKVLPGIPPSAVYYLRTLDDALALRDRLLPGAHVAIAGAGVIGLEFAASARGLSVDVTILEAEDRAMGRAVSPEVSARLQKLHEAEGVCFRFGTRVDTAENTDEGLNLTLSNGAHLNVDFLLVAIGINPNTKLADDAGIATQNGIIVDEFGRTSVPDIWAVGDVARHPAYWSPVCVRQETWRHADAHARAVASAIIGHETEYNPVPGFWSDQYDRRLQVEGVIQGQEILQDSPNGDFAAIYLDEIGKLQGCAVLNNPKIATLTRKALRRNATVDVLLASKPDANLREILKSI